MSKDLEQLLGLIQSTANQFWYQAGPILDRLLDERLQEALLAFLVGVSLGWFIRSLIKAKPQPSGHIHGNPGLHRNKGANNLYLDRDQDSNLNKLADDYDKFAASADKIRRKEKYQGRGGLSKEEVEYKSRKRL